MSNYVQWTSASQTRMCRRRIQTWHKALVPFQFNFSFLSVQCTWIDVMWEMPWNCSKMFAISNYIPGLKWKYQIRALPTIKRIILHLWSDTSMDCVSGCIDYIWADIVSRTTEPHLGRLTQVPVAWFDIFQLISEWLYFLFCPRFPSLGIAFLPFPFFWTYVPYFIDGRRVKIK